MLCFRKCDWAPIRHTLMGYQGEDCSLPEITQAAVVGCQFRLVRNQWLLLQPTEGLWDLNTMLRCWKSCLTNVISQSKACLCAAFENFLTCQVSFSSFCIFWSYIFYSFNSCPNFSTFLPVLSLTHKPLKYKNQNKLPKRGILFLLFSPFLPLYLSLPSLILLTSFLVWLGFSVRLDRSE